MGITCTHGDLLYLLGVVAAVRPNPNPTSAATRPPTLTLPPRHAARILPPTPSSGPEQVRGDDGCVVLRGRRRVERTQAEGQGVGSYVAKRARGTPTPLRWGSGAGGGADDGGGAPCATPQPASRESGGGGAAGASGEQSAEAAEPPPSDMPAP